MAVGVIYGLFETFRTKGPKGKETITFTMSGLTTLRKKIATPAEEKLLRPAGGLTYFCWLRRNF